jgi:tetratricopeptide (TPR) repeat protein
MNVVKLKQLGDHYEEMGDYESAELLFRRALAVQEKEVGEDHPSLAVDLYNLGLLCYAQSKFLDAETMLTRAWAIELNSFGPVHPETVATLDALSEIYYDANRNVELEYRGLVSSRLPYGQPVQRHYH